MDEPPTPSDPPLKSEFVPHKSLDRLMLTITGSLAAAVVVCLGFIGWSLYTPMSFFEVKEAEWKIVAPGKVLRPRDEVYVDIHACKQTDLPAEIGRMIVGSAPGIEAKQLIILPDVSGSFAEGCRHLNVSVATLPLGMLPGQYRVFIVIRYRYSALRMVEHQFVTEEFEVAE